MDREGTYPNSGSWLSWTHCWRLRGDKHWLEYLGVTLDKVTGWNWTAFVHPEDVEEILAKWRACLATGRNLPVRNSRPQGEWRIPLDVSPESTASRCKRQ